MPQDNKIKIRRGLDANLPDFNTEIGELRYSTDTKKLYIDDGTANRYIGGDVNAFPISTAAQQALNNKLDKDGNAATATALQTARTLTIGNTGKSFDGSGNVSWSLAEIGAQSILTNPITGTGTTNFLPKFTSSGILGNSLIYDNGTNVGIGTTSPSEKLEVNGNVKATQIKDQYGSLKSQRVITITGNITLSEIHNGAILHITNTCNITIPTGLGADFSCDCYVKGAFIATFVNGGVTLNSPSGLLLKTDKMATLYSSASNVLNLLGELATS